MSMTMAEKILAKASSKNNVEAGEIVMANIDVAMMHDLTGPLAIESFNKIGTEKVWDKDKIIIPFDHQVPADSLTSANNHILMRNFVKNQNITNFYDMYKGVCHQILPELGHVVPGEVIVGADSHTCTHGAFGAFSTGIGSTDMAMVLSTGKLWFKVPETIKFNIEGKLKENVYSKDVILKIIGDTGVDGATYKSCEFSGPIIEDMSISDRMVLSNMAVEMGAKNGIMEPNEATLNYVMEKTGKTKNQLNILKSDKDAIYEKEYLFNVEDLEAQIACPNDVDNVKNLSKVEGTHIDQGFIGSCTNGRLSDLEAAAKILEGEKVLDDVRLIIIPASKDIYQKAMDKGLLKIFLDAGAIVCNPGCGPCLGGHMGVLSEGEVSISSTNRNFKGRMGDPKSSVYLANPAVVAASAIKGFIENPENIK